MSRYLVNISCMPLGLTRNMDGSSRGLYLGLHRASKAVLGRSAQRDVEQNPIL